MASKPRVGIVAERFFGPGGIQTCFIELIIGLNQRGITPSIIWDEEQNWKALDCQGLSADHGGGRLAIPSRLLRRMPSRLYSRLAPLSIHFADLHLGSYDFVYSFVPGARMEPRVPNLCYAIGPPFIKMPDEVVNWSRALSRTEIRKIIHLVSNIPVRPDPNSRYVTLSEWIAEKFVQEHGLKLPVIWPPVRSRTYDTSRGKSKSGFLFLSRLHEYKNPGAMLVLAAAHPEARVTIAGSSRTDRTTAMALRNGVVSRKLSNVDIVENPSEGDVRRLLSEHEFFVFPAAWEHFGIVTVEAILAGLIPLVHNTGGQREIVPDDQLRFDDAKGLVEAAGRAMKMAQEEKAALIQKLRVHVERGSPENYRQEMIAYIKNDVSV